jgi:hypothetical protein
VMVLINFLSFLNVLWTEKVGTNFANKKRHSVGIVRSWTQATEFFFFVCFMASSSGT